MIWIALLISILCYYTVARRFQNWILIAISIVVYWQYVHWYAAIIGALAIAVASCHKQLIARQNKSYVIVPIIVLVGCFALLHSNINGILFPVGYSIFAFSSISLLVDQYRKPCNYSYSQIISYLLFFPKLLAGPIERADAFISTRPKAFNAEQIYVALKLLVFASFCKYLVSDRLCAVSMDGTGLVLMCKSVCYGLQFYFDFWAYSLMAIAFGKLYGYELSSNFLNPYYATGFKDFWRRWNITLGLWLKDYIYIPLGGSRVSKWRHYANLTVTFIVSALWHGLTIPFMLWGVIHALLVFAESHLNVEQLRLPMRIIYRVFAILVIVMLWQTFRMHGFTELYNYVNLLFTASALDIAAILRLAICLLLLIVLSCNQLQGLIYHNLASKKAIIAEVITLSIMAICLVLYNCDINSNFFYLSY
jgi:alginate O-acetyltransferase complex protein AlgI